MNGTESMAKAGEINSTSNVKFAETPSKAEHGLVAGLPVGSGSCCLLTISF